MILNYSFFFIAILLFTWHLWLYLTYHIDTRARAYKTPLLEREVIITDWLCPSKPQKGSRIIVYGKKDECFFKLLPSISNIGYFYFIGRIKNNKKTLIIITCPSIFDKSGSVLFAIWSMQISTMMLGLYSDFEILANKMTPIVLVFATGYYVYIYIVLTWAKDQIKDEISVILSEIIRIITSPLADNERRE